MKHAAMVLGLTGEIGTIREGARADLLVVRGNAVQDVGCLADVLMVVQAGEIIRLDVDNILGGPRE